MTKYLLLCSFFLLSLPELFAQKAEEKKQVLRIESIEDLPQDTEVLQIESEEDLKRLEQFMLMQESMQEDKQSKEGEREELLEALRKTYEEERKNSPEAN